MTAFTLVAVPVFVLMFVFVSFELLVGLFSESVELGIHCFVRLHDFEHLLSGELIPVGRHDLRCRVQSPDVFHDAVEFFGAHPLLMREEYGARVLDLVSEELSEVLHVHLVSLGVYNCGESVEFDPVIVEILDRDDDVGELAHTGRFDEYPVRIVLLDHFIEGLAEVSHEGAANASCYHLIYLDARFSQESCVDSDLAELVLDQNDVLRVVAFGYEFLDERCLSCSEKSGEDIHFCHFVSFFPDEGTAPPRALSGAHNSP